MNTPPPRNPRHSRPAHENYSIGGLLICASIVPAVVILLAAPALVIAFTLGALTAIGVSHRRTRRRNR